MSTTTNFKRVALVAVAALGLGVLSSVPSQAVINQDNLTVSSTTAAQTTNDTATATNATVTLSFLGAADDSASVTASLVSGPAGNTALPFLSVSDSSTTSTTISGLKAGSNTPLWLESTGAALVSVTAKVFLTRDSTDGTTAPLVAGDYVVKLTPAVTSNGSALSGATAKTITITVTKAAALDTNASAAKSTAVLVKGGSYLSAEAKAQTTDSVVAVVATEGTFAGLIYVAQKNAAGTTSANESMTAVISGQGILGAGSDTRTAAAGRSISVKNGDFVTVWSDGAAGKGVVTITGSTSGAVLATKTVTFTGTLASFTDAKAAVAIITPVAATPANAVTFLAKDSGLNTIASGTYYAFSSDTSIVTVESVTYSTDSGTVSVQGVKAGTATITIGNASTLAASTIKSTPVSIRVGSTSIASVKVAFDKATYSIGEKAIITVTGLDSTNLPTVPGTIASFFSSGLKEDKLFSQNALSVDSTTVKFDSAASTTNGTAAGSAVYVVYMPLTSGKVTVTGTLGTIANLATAIQDTDVTASATVTDSASAALAAVTALATTVASLKTLIVTLTNLVLKIQKKVKA